MTDQHHLRVPLTWSIAVSVVIAAIAWGVNTSRVTALEKDAEKAEQVSVHATQEIAQLKTQTAVLQSQLSQIIEQLKEIDRKLDRQERQR